MQTNDIKNSIKNKQQNTQIFTKNQFASLLLALICFGQIVQAAPLMNSQEIINMDWQKKQLRTYVESGLHAAQQAQSIALARQLIMSQLNVASSKPKAVIFDVDDTILDHSHYIVSNDFAYIEHMPNNLCLYPKGACAWQDWVNLASAPVIEPSLALIKELNEQNIQIILLTGRNEKDRKATQDNLNKHGINYAQLIMRNADNEMQSAKDYKLSNREKLHKQYHLIANIGDQDSDLAGGMPSISIKMPNPFYFIK